MKPERYNPVPFDVDATLRRYADAVCCDLRITLQPKADKRHKARASA